MHRESNLSILQNPEDAEMRRKEFGGPIFGLFVFVPLLAIAAAISVPVAFIWGRLATYKLRRFERRMLRAGRTIGFSEALDAVRGGEGTLIFEYRTLFKGPVRTWWTGEDIYARAPYPCADHYHMGTDPNFRPFLEWFHQEYLSVNGGRALFVMHANEKNRSLGKKELEDVRRIAVPTMTDEGW